MAKRILMTGFLKKGYHVISDGSGLIYEDNKVILRITFIKGYVYWVNGSKHLEEFNPEKAKDIFDKVEAIKQIAGEQLVRVEIKEEVFG